MANRKTFVDTSAFFGALSLEDPSHARIDAILHDPHRSFVTTDWVLGESVNLCVARRRAHLGIRLLDQIESSARLQVVYGSESLFREASALLRKFRDHAFPFTDCISFVVMRQLRIDDALTTDRHFQVLGFRPLLA